MRPITTSSSGPSKGSVKDIDLWEIPQVDPDQARPSGASNPSSKDTEEKPTE